MTPSVYRTSRRRADVRSDRGHAGDRGLRSRERADHRCSVRAAGGRGWALRSRAMSFENFVHPDDVADTYASTDGYTPWRLASRRP